MSILDTAGWHDPESGGSMVPDALGAWIRENDPILLAMQRVCRAAEIYTDGQNQFFGNGARIAEAVYALRALTEDKP